MEKDDLRESQVFECSEHGLDTQDTQRQPTITPKKATMTSMSLFPKSRYLHHSRCKASSLEKCPPRRSQKCLKIPQAPSINRSEEPEQ